MNRKVRKHTFIVILSITVALCILEYGIVLNKNRNISMEKQPQLVFSHESGFYAEEFELEMFCDTNREGRIFYTLDGSEPNTYSLLYEGPILITDVSLNENVHSMRTDVSVGFMEDKIEQYCPDRGTSGYTVPEYKVDKATIVRAVVYFNEYQHSEIHTASYFVGFSEKEGYDGMNVLSIVTNPDNLFDYETGIYVTGETFDEYWEVSTEDNEQPDDNWLWWSSNYTNRGKEWEREVSCQFFNENRELLLNQTCGLRIHGGISRGQNPKGINLYARESYDGNNRFLYDFWSNDYYASAITLSQGGNDYYTKLKDSLISELLEDGGLEIALLNFEPYAMFLDGEYWGVYWLCEKYDEKYVEHYYDVAGNNVIMIKNGAIEAGSQGDFRLWENMVYTCETLDVTQEENWNKVCDLIDIESYIDYYAVMMYAARNKDWPNGNYAAWRTKAVDKNQEYSDGKWRWMVFDMNSPAMSTDLIEFDSIEYVMEKNDMFRNLMTNKSFRQKLLDRMEELRGNVFDAERVNQLIDEHVSLMKEPLKADQKRFFGIDSDEKIYSKIAPVREFFNYRGGYVEQMLEKYR